MSNYPWNIHFRDHLEHWKLPADIDPSSLDALEVALRSGVITNPAYLQWAQESFLLPILDETYFEITEPNLEFWNQWKNKFNWSASLYPVGAWDGHLFVACLMPPENFPVEWQPVFVIGSPHGLHKFWHKLNPSAKEHHSPLQPANNIGQAAMPLEPNSGVKSDELTEPSLESLELIDIEDVKDEPNQSEIDTDQGANTEESDKLDLEIAPSLYEKTLTALSDLSTAIPVNTLKKLNREPENQSQEEKTLTPPTQAKTGPTGTIAAKIPDAIPSSISLSPTPKVEKVADPSVRPLPSITKASSTATHEINLGASKRQQPTQQQTYHYTKAEEHLTPRTPTSPATTPTPLIKSQPTVVEQIETKINADFVLAYLAERFPEQIHNALESFGQKIKMNFDKIVLLATNQDDTSIKFVSGELALQDLQIKNFTLSLSEPSIFSIVSRTLKPYHGYVIVNAINEMFFDEILQGIVPEHVTITPVVVDDQLIGMIFASGDRSSYTRHVLQHFEELTREFTTKLKNLKSGVLPSAS